VQDFFYVLGLIVFFAVAGLFVLACDHIIGPDEAALTEGARGAPEPAPATERVAA
jgi:hypothetical protein